MVPFSLPLPLVNHDTTKAFLAGIVLPSIAYYYLFRRQQWLLQKNTYDDDDENDNDLFEDVVDDNNNDDDDDNDNVTTATGVHPVDPLGNVIVPMSKWNSQQGPYKMLLIVNTELGMGKGKMAAQCGHAAIGCYEQCIQKCPRAVQVWYHTGCAKIALKCTTTTELVSLTKLAQQKYHLPYYLVEDAGRTQIAAGSRTVLGVFAPTSYFEGFTDHLKLL
jgi:peptidyl-tRNA hydrolase, PTH2 family